MEKEKKPRLRLIPDPPSRNPDLAGTTADSLETMDRFHEQVQKELEEDNKKLLEALKKD